NKLECKNTSKQQKDAQEQADKEAAAAPKETTSLFNNDLDGVINAKYAAQALRNLEKAENLEEALELIKEIESLEFENYSKLSYLGPELEGQQLKKIKIDNIVSRVLINTFFPEAHADN